MNPVIFSCDNSLKAKCGIMELTEFWILIKDEHPFLNNKKEISNKIYCGKENENSSVQFCSKILEMCNDQQL